MVHGAVTQRRKDGSLVTLVVCHLKNSEVGEQFQKCKGREVLRGDVVKDDSGDTEQESSSCHMTAAQVLDVIIRLPDALEWCSISLHPTASDLLRLPKSECPTIWMRQPRSRCPKSWDKTEDLVAPLESHVYFLMTSGIDNARCVETSSNVREENGAACESALRKNEQTVFAQLELSRLRSSKPPSFAREDFIRDTMPQPTTTAADSSIRLASFTKADDVSAFTVDTLHLESSVSTENVIGHEVPTRQFPPRASQRLTMCQRCLSYGHPWVG